MRSKRRLWTIVAVAVWMVALILTSAPAPVEAEAGGGGVVKLGWMVYTPNHPNGCAPLPYDCYVVWVY